MRVLFVDDEINFLTPLLKRLRKRGIDTQGVNCGYEALHLLQTESYDVVVLDLKMPGICGHTTLREIRKLFPLLPVIILTGNANPEDTIQGLEQGAFAYLIKPIVSLDELIYRLEDAHKAAHLDLSSTKKQDEENSIGA